ncbi:PilZ domain-containing protein [Pseudomonas sp. NCCP-436]|uniref:PilZ domain-containing protein n=1 Tax=Pseudomonas sp. NCCP-436 TaxID=2842481 RepID=UPI001C80F83C|nr:PilZ domain-containing protein [Pseudomonas sp. NCCP-436]GIZ12944.1 cyclic diguanosine monophosphate-binding protein [Pseudomonas sp. NCCP-436]
MTDKDHDRRRFQRIDFNAPCLLVQGKRQWPVKLHDLSLKGLMVEPPGDWDADPEHPFEVHIRLGNEAEVTMEVLLARSQNRYLGFVCSHIDLDSISHLRRLVELNLGDEALLERELNALGEASD